MSKGRRHGSEPVAHEINPDAFFAHAADKKAARKERQLCRQVKEALDYALPALTDELLQDCLVIDVEPCPDASRLCVVVCAPEGLDPEEILSRLERASGLLRREVAEAITRKRTPTLCFRVEWEEPS